MPRKSVAKTLKSPPKQQAVASFTQGYIPPMLVGEAFANDYPSDSSDTTVGKRTRLRLPNNVNKMAYNNIRNAPNPFHNGGTTLDVREAITLCQKAYWNFPLLKNTIDVMTELTNSRLYLKGGNQKTRDFIGAWLDKIGIWSLKEEFFREFFRSGNNILLRLNGDLLPNDVKKMTQVYGSLNNTSIPIRYIILNPAEIRVGANISFMEPLYYKVFSNYEIERLKYPKTPEDKEILKSLGADAIKEIKSGVNPTLQLNPEDLIAVFYKKQPYEPMAVPFAYPLLEDIDAKMELKRLDMKVARLTDRALLLVTAGAKPTEGGVNPATLTTLQTIFANESLSRTLVADYTVKGEWLIPDIDKILGPQKYVQLDKDIAAGLNAILFNTSTDEKFSNTSIKIQIFIERLKEARSAFLQKFLQPEIIEICKSINAKTYPEAVFEEINLRDELQYNKLYTQLAQIGLLTPSELFDAMESGKLPLAEDSLADQEEYKTQRDKGLYMPLIGGATQDEGAAGSPVGNGAGRPSGTKAPQSSKKISPIGTSSATLNYGFSASKLKEVAQAATELQDEIGKKLRRKFKIKALNDAQQSVANLMVQSIMANEDMDKWQSSILSYMKNPKDIPQDAADEIDDICIAHNVESGVGSILRLCKA